MQTSAVASRRSIVEDGARIFDACLALASEPSATAVLLLPEMFGLTDAMCAAASDFAALGYITAAINVFWRSAHPQTLGYDGKDRDMANARLDALDIDAVVDDIDTAAAWLKAEIGTSRIVALGHCIGGRLAMLALGLPSIAGAVSYYGLGISKQGAALAAVRKPAQLHYGLADPHVPRAEIEAVASFSKGNPAIEIFRYDGAGHSFCNPNRPMYDVAAAAQVRARTLAFLAECVT